MRRARIKVAAEVGDGVYHLMSRTVNGERVLNSAAKDVLRRLIWRIADFAGLEVLTYAILSNHFHILVRVPRKAPVGDEELLRRYSVLYPKPTKHQFARLEVVKAQLRSNGPEAAAWRRRLLSLMNDVSQYMKLVKQRYSMWHNRVHDRFGPVWADRFKSVLVEPTGHVIETMAAYIDLNCVRAGLATDPKDYRFCGYAEAVAGSEVARSGLRTVIGGTSWSTNHSQYRQLLFANGSVAREGAPSVTEQTRQQVIRQGGHLPLPEVLRCRVRYFSEGVVLGSRAFVEMHLADYRRRHGGGERMKVHSLPAVTTWGEIAGMKRLSGELLG